MKSGKKALAAVLAASLCAVSVPVFAAGEGGAQDGSKAIPSEYGLNDGLIVDFDMETVNENAVINKADSSAFAVEGAAAGQTEGPEGHGKALRFDGNTNYINLGKDYQFPTGEATVAAWVKIDPDAYSLERIVCRSRTAVENEKELALYVNSGDGSLWAQSDMNAVNGGKVEKDQWVHVAMTNDGEKMTVYVNGEAAASGKTEGVSPDQEDVDMVVGTGWNTEGTAPFTDHMFKGALDELKIYNRGLTEDEIRELADAQDGGSEPSETPEPIYELTMDEIKDGTGSLSGQKVIINSADGKEYPIYGGAVVDDFGIYGKSIRFDGSTAYANIGKPDMGTEYTLSAWVYLELGAANNMNKIFGRDRTTVAENMYWVAVRGDNGKVDVSLDGANLGAESGIFKFGEWVNITVTNTPEKAALYLNGELISSGGGSSVDQNSHPLDMLLGCGYNAAGDGIYNGHAFKGRMDDVRIYNQALTADQIRDYTDSVLDKIPPEVNKITPEEGTLISAEGRLEILYNMTIAGGEEKAILTDKSGKDIKISVSIEDQDESIEGGDTLVIVPDEKLSTGETYTYEIPAGTVVNQDGVANLAASYTYTVSQDLAGNSADSELDYWALRDNGLPVTIEEKDGKLTMSNGLVTRTFDLEENFLTVGYENLYTGIDTLDESNLQADVVFSLNDEYIDEDTSSDTKFDIGGTDETVPTFVYDGYKIEEKTKEPYHWEYDERISPPSMKDTAWPAKGKALVVNFKAPESADEIYQGVEIQVRYEIYEGIPVISKIINVTNNGEKEIYVHRMATEVLPIPQSLKDSLYFETDMNMGYNNHSRNNGKFEYRQWDDLEDGRGLLTCQYLMYSFNNMGRYEESYGPNYGLEKGESFTSYKLYELFHSNSYFEWQNMEIKKMYRVLFPQICDAPLIYHVIASDTERVKAAVDQAEEAGFNLVLMSFGSGANVEDISEANIAHYKDICDYAHERGIMIGAYVMQYARYDNDASTDTGDRCMVSGNAETTLENTLKFIDATGMDCLEVDGPYPGGVCSKKNGDAANHHHDGAEDSIVKQWEYAIRDFYKELRERNVYINAPDWQYAAGASMGVMGYKEAGWAAPTKAQLIYSREMSYNAMFEKTPSMGWTMVPLDPYRGGADASFWPYNDKIEDYDFIVGVNMMYGVVGSYRGSNGLYQEGMAKNVLETWTDFYNKYRDILGADIVHIAPPLRENTQSTQTEAIDGFIHASADSEQKGLAAFFNQTGETVTQKIKIPLYFTGLTDCKTPPAPVEGSHYRQTLIETELKVQPPVPDIPEVEAVPTDKTAYVCIGDMDGQEYTIDSNGNIEIELTMEPDTYTWLTIYDPDDVPDSVGSTADIAVPENLAVKGSSSGSVTLGWDAVQKDGRDVKEYHVYRDGEYIGKTFENTYTDGTAEADKNYVYEVSAVHNTVAGGKAKINVSTEEDVAAPMIESAKAISENQVEIRFNESVDAETADNPVNYTVTDNEVTEAVLGSDLRTVTLTVKYGFQPFIELQAEAANVKDLAGNSAAEGSCASFVFGYLREFKFEEDGGSTAVDSIYGENALINGTSQTRQPGISGNGLAFDGESSYVSVGSVVNDLSKYSISGWFMPEAAEGNQTIVGQQRDNYDGWRWNLYLEDGVLKFVINNGKGTYPGDIEGAEEIALQLESGEAKASAGEWNQFALVRDGDTFTLYLNGVEVDTGTQAGIDQSESPYLSMLGGFLNTAGGEPTAQFKGMMDEIVYYNTPISDEMVKALYDEGSKPADETDKTELQKLYDQYKDLTQGNYTDISWEKFQKALDEAKAVLDADDASQKWVDDVKTALENAYNALTEKEEPTDPGEEENPGGGDSDKPGSGDGQNPDAGSDSGKAAQTGDAANPALLIALAALAAGTAAVTAKRRKR